MSKVRTILGSRLARRAGVAATALACMAGCGQRGALYLPTDPAAADRATLPQILNPNRTPPAQRSPLPPGAALPPAPPPADDSPLFGPDTGQANPVRTP